MSALFWKTVSLSAMSRKTGVPTSSSVRAAITSPSRKSAAVLEMSSMFLWIIIVIMALDWFSITMPSTMFAAKSSRPTMTT